jgi:DMSO reductase family type II enzyme heme b subunit
MKAIELPLPGRTLLNPAGAHWQTVPAEDIDLGPAPLHAQPSRYVRTVLAGKTLGAVRSVSVRAAHNGETICFRLEWLDATRNADHGDGSVFPDAAAVLFPINGDAPLLSMGSPEAPVNAWFWRASLPEGTAQNLIAAGLGTVEPAAGAGLEARASWNDRRWTVVLARPLSVATRGGARMAVGARLKTAFAVWDGASQERGGLKSVSARWLELSIEKQAAGQGG